MNNQDQPKTEGWANVIAVAKEAAKAYAAMIKASDALADAMGYKEEYVLRRVLPQNADERRAVKRILEWVNSEQDGVEKWLAEREELRRKQRERDALMAKLKLTPEEKALLGIDDEAEFKKMSADNKALALITDTM